jgi:uncharacterized membrane protein
MPAAVRRRDWRIDALRGVGIILMVAYHLVWDLAALGFIDPANAGTPAFRRLGALIASLFLFVSGVALVLARQAAPDEGAFRSGFLKRLAIIAGAAALVSLGTWLAMGDRFVRFGVLHCIALSAVIALPVLRAPAWAALAAAAALLAAPWLIDVPALSHPALIWLGLSSQTPAMVDYVPMFPFAGVALLGVAAGPSVARRLGQPAETGQAGGLLAIIGRWSLPIYLVHQPILYGGLFLLAAATAPAVGPGLGPVDTDTAGFRRECRRACEGQGNGKEHCDRYCACAETEMKSSGIWARVMAGPQATTIQPELAPLLQACFAKAQSGS